MCLSLLAWTSLHISAPILFSSTLLFCSSFLNPGTGEEGLKAVLAALVDPQDKMGNISTIDLDTRCFGWAIVNGIYVEVE